MGIVRYMACGVGLYLGLVGLMRFAGEGLIFPVPGVSYGHSEDLIYLEGVVGRFYEVEDKGQEKGVILYSHGNGQDIGQLEELAMGYVQRGYSILVYDYPGYGLSEGKPTEAGVYEAGELFYEYLIDQRGYDEIILYGFSLGGGAAVHLASKYENVRALVLQGTFLSAYRVLTYWPIFLWDRFENYKLIGDIGVPTLFIHGKKDDIIGFNHGQELYKLCNAAVKEKYWVKQGDHNNLPAIAGKEYWERVVAFLEMGLPPQTPLGD